jgi:hypothetical protein
MWGNDKPQQKRAGGHGTGWLLSPQGYRVVLVTCLPASADSDGRELVTVLLIT